MSELSIFDHPKFGNVRIVDHNGDPWFVARDIALALGYVDPAQAIKDNCKKVNKITQQVSGTGSIKTPPVNILIIPEGDVYRLIMRSKLKDAQEFEEWVMEEVLPSIRKTGSYGNIQTPALPDFSNPAEAARAWADAYEAQQLAQATAKAALAERDHAIKTKAEIGTRREATAMATASSAVRQLEKARQQIGDSRLYKQVKAIPWITEVFSVRTNALYSQIGKRLTAIGKERDMPPIEIENSEYGTVKAHHVDVIKVLYGRLLADKKMLANFRE